MWALSLSLSLSRSLARSLATHTLPSALPLPAKASVRFNSASTWQVVGGGELPLVNECTFARRPSDGKILYMSRAQDTQHGANPITATRIAFSLYSDDLKTNSALAPVQGIANPVCEGLLIASTSTGRFYLLLES